MPRDLSPIERILQEYYLEPMREAVNGPHTLIEEFKKQGVLTGRYESQKRWWQKRPLRYYRMKWWWIRNVAWRFARHNPADDCEGY